MSDNKYYGLYCPQHGIWLEDESQHIFYYPSAELMNAHWNQMQEKAKHFSALRYHLYEVTEIGTEKRISPESSPPGSVVCPEQVNRFKRLANTRIA